MQVWKPSPIRSFDWVKLLRRFLIIFERHLRYFMNYFLLVVIFWGPQMICVKLTD